MDSITLQNYRCFGSEKQTARLAPLTLLVGPNGTGKTSFLALIRALWDVAFREVAPNFREHPYDLGSWDNIIHQPGGRNGRADSFLSGFAEQDGLEFAATFAEDAAAPFPITRRFVNGEAGFELHSRGSGCPERAQYRIVPGEWQPWVTEERTFSNSDGPFPIGLIARLLLLQINQKPNDDAEKIRRLLDVFDLRTELDTRPFASAPARSRPRRTCDPARLSQDSEGDYIPSYLAGTRSNLYWRVEEGMSHDRCAGGQTAVREVRQPWLRSNLRYGCRGRSDPTGGVDPEGPALGAGQQSGAHPAQDLRRPERFPSGGGAGHVGAPTLVSMNSVPRATTTGPGVCWPTRWWNWA